MEPFNYFKPLYIKYCSNFLTQKFSWTVQNSFLTVQNRKNRTPVKASGRFRLQDITLMIYKWVNKSISPEVWFPEVHNQLVNSCLQSLSVRWNSKGTLSECVLKVKRIIATCRKKWQVRFSKIRYTSKNGKSEEWDKNTRQKSEILTVIQGKKGYT